VSVDLIPFFSTGRNFETSSFVIVPSSSHPGKPTDAKSLRSGLLEKR
jgi:hypothetical protein